MEFVGNIADVNVSFTITDTPLIQEIKNHVSPTYFMNQLINVGYQVINVITPIRSECSCCSEIKTEVNELSERLAPFNTGGNSTRNGQLGEIFACVLFKKRNPNIAYQDTSKIEKSGDAIVTLSNHIINSIMIDYKNYDSPVPSTEVDKLVRDMKTQNIQFGIILSYKSKISKRRTIDYDIIDGKLIVFIAAYGLDIFTLEMAIQYIQRLHECNVLSISTKLHELVSRGNMKKISDVYESVYGFACQLSQTINSIKENQDKLNKMFYGMIHDCEKLLTQMNLLLEGLDTDMNEIHRESVTSSHTYTELNDIVDRVIDKEKDKSLSQRILNITQRLHISGFYSEKDNSIHFTNVGKLMITKSRVTMLFYNHSEAECSFNPMYEAFKNGCYHIILSDDSSKWDIIERRFTQN